MSRPTPTPTTLLSPSSAPSGPPPAAAAPARPPAIPVALIRFDIPIDLPGKSVAEGLSPGTRAQVFSADGRRINNTPVFVVEFQPWLRHHRIDLYPPGGGAPETWFVHESHARNWKAAPA